MRDSRVSKNTMRLLRPMPVKYALPCAERSDPSMTNTPPRAANPQRSSKVSSLSLSAASSSGEKRLKSGYCDKIACSLDEALNFLEKDHEFLLQGDVFTRDVISTWIWYKREKEVDAIRLRPHPFEFALYYDI